MAEERGISKEILAAILNGIDEGIHVVDLEGNTIYYNDIAAKHDGLNVNEVLGKPLLSVFPSLNDGTSTLLKVMETNKPIFNETQSYVNLHGDQIETINTTLPIQVDGRIAGAVEIAKDYSRLKLLSESLMDLRNMVSKPRTKKKQVSNNSIQYTLDSLLTANNKMKGIKEEAKKLAKSDSPILVFGESGSGKELFVQGIHHASLRPDAPFIAQNCAAIPESLLESVLFGTAKGSYTGALDRPGLFELADGGTLFLDEIHAMPIELQAKLLRVIEDGQVRRIGSTTSTYVNFRVIAAMNIHPRQAMEKQKIRTDLFYRLNVLTFELIPLRERTEDIFFLTDHFIQTYNQRFHKNISGVNNQVKHLFAQYKWPGNVRELKHTIEYMMNVCEGDTLCEADLPIMLKQQTRNRTSDAVEESMSLRERIAGIEKDLIETALLKTEGNILKAAKLLEIPRQTLQYKLQKLETANAE
ncbi:sigma-54 interaction domain-containing protein [Cytobacillus purgationiresistens]|uniref:Arginine utilization regulatory protein n=1 Tax=Cytobacillus purgationiresistens TaxID=863449 RepID=A0ABU0ALR6_9BACI|nr:arginine utilization regulatory protein [Cytobacillus purgationiresistens]